MPPLYQDVTGVILAGGRSRRFGQNKAFASFQQTPIIHRILGVMRSMFPDLFLVTNTPEEYLSLPIKILTDKMPYQGPLGGIVTAMENSSNPRLFVVACDMPLVNPALIREIVERGRGWEAAIPVHHGQKEYLTALYSKDLLRPMKTAFQDGIRSLHEFCRELDRVVYFPVDGDASFNVNTPQDLRDLEERYAL